MNWHAFFAVIAVASAIAAWISLMYGITGTRHAQLYSLTVALVLICATASGLSC
jgi:hypothetical protein